MAASKPGTYFASILFSLSLFVVLVTLVTLVIANPKLRASMSVFTVAFAVGSVVILTMLFMRVLAAERLASRTIDPTTKFSVRPCPDTHILNDDRTECVPDTDTTLTMTKADGVTFTNPVKYTSKSYKVDLDKSHIGPATTVVVAGASNAAATSHGSPSSWTAKDLKDECTRDSSNTGVFLKFPHSQLAPYCAET